MTIAPWIVGGRGLCSSRRAERIRTKSSRSNRQRFFQSIAFTIASAPCGFSPDTHGSLSCIRPRSHRRSERGILECGGCSALTPSKQQECNRSARACAWTLEFIFEGDSNSRDRSVKKMNLSPPESSSMRSREACNPPHKCTDVAGYGECWKCPCRQRIIVFWRKQTTFAQECDWMVSIAYAAYSECAVAVSIEVTVQTMCLLSDCFGANFECSVLPFQSGFR